MADDEQFSLCWNNFNSNLSAGFHESLCRGDLVDVTLAAEGQFVKAHRLVLSVCSPYFRKMFTQMPANQHAFVFLKDVSHSALKDLIQFMYCGEVNVKQEALPAFISTAEALQIKGLTDGDPAPSQSPAKPSTPAPQPAPPAQALISPRVRQRSSTSRSYRIETDDSDDKTTTQIVLQAAPAVPQQTQPTIVQQTTTAVVTQKRSAPRSISTPHTKRVKNSSDPLEASEPTQIAIQTVTESKASSEPEFIDLPIEMPTKSEPDYTEETGEVETAEQDATYVEDDSYGDMKYDESYFTENEEAGAATGGTGGATTSTAVVKQSFVDNSYVEQADQSASEAQGRKNKKRISPAKSKTPIKKLQKKMIDPLKDTQQTIRNPNIKSISDDALKKEKNVMEIKQKNCTSSANLIAVKNKKTVMDELNLQKPVLLSACADFTAPENVIKTSANKHTLIVIKRARLKGVCVQCIKNANASNIKSTFTKIVTYCPQCPGGDWICEPCFDVIHNRMQGK